MNPKALMNLTANVLNTNRYYPYQAIFIAGGYIDSLNCMILMQMVVFKTSLKQYLMVRVILQQGF